MADVAEYVDLLVDPKHRIAVTGELHAWYQEQGSSRVWVEGNESGRLVVCDVPPAALVRLGWRGIRYDTRPRPAGRPLPVFVATLGRVAGA